jgi:hypothetical protein
VGIDSDPLAPDFNHRPGLSDQIMEPSRVMLLAPVGCDQKVVPVGKEIGDGRQDVFARLSSDAVQQQDALGAQLAAHPAAAEADCQDIDCHEEFEQGFIQWSPETLFLEGSFHWLPVIIDPALGELLCGAFGKIGVGEIKAGAFRNGSQLKRYF